MMSAFSVINNCYSQTSNYLTEGVSYYHNEEQVSQSDYVTTAKFNPKTVEK